MQIAPSPVQMPELIRKKSRSFADKVHRTWPGHEMILQNTNSMSGKLRCGFPRISGAKSRLGSFMRRLYNPHDQKPLMPLSGGSKTATGCSDKQMRTLIPCEHVTGIRVGGGVESVLAPSHVNSKP